MKALQDHSTETTMENSEQPNDNKQNHTNETTATVATTKRAETNYDGVKSNDADDEEKITRKLESIVQIEEEEKEIGETVSNDEGDDDDDVAVSTEDTEMNVVDDKRKGNNAAVEELKADVVVVADEVTSSSSKGEEEPIQKVVEESVEHATMESDRIINGTDDNNSSVKSMRKEGSLLSGSTVKAATQMAAVAVAATSSCPDKQSHEKVAEFARGITATLAKVPQPVNVDLVCASVQPVTALTAPLVWFTHHIPSEKSTDRETAQQVAMQIQNSLLPQIQSCYQQLEQLLPSDTTTDLLPAMDDATALFFEDCSIPPPPVEEKPPNQPNNNNNNNAPNGRVVSNIVNSVTSLVKKNKTKIDLPPSEDTDKEDDNNNNANNSTGEYSVVIEREMLGLTVENVLERTVVRTVLAGGAAKKAGAKVGSLIVQVGSSSTENLTHFETIDELRQSQRPLKLRLKKLSKPSLRQAREEMGRLIRGGGFGVLHTIETPFLATTLSQQNPTRTLLVKILFLLIFGLEQQGQTADAKSVSKILFDFLQPPAPVAPVAPPKTTKKSGNMISTVRPPSKERLALLKIGDVLHRTRSFLADPESRPACLLKGDLICLLCDVLDMDTEMILAEEESSSTSINHESNKGVGDLGSAGNLLKLIILHHCEKGGNRFLAVVHRLAASRSMAARVTACSLGPVLWGHLDFCYQLQLRGVLTRALHDVEVMVRKSTAAVLHEIAELVFDARVVPWLVLMCERAMTDPEPQLRAAAMTFTWHLAEHLPNAFDGDASQGSIRIQRLPSRDHPTFAPIYLLQCKLLPVATRLGEDRSPMVRISVAAQCDRLATALGCHWFSVLIDLLLALLGDAEEAVRSEACLCLPRFVESVLLGSSDQTTVLDSTLPVARKLLKDPSSSVRMSLATACGELLTLLVGLQFEPTTVDNSKHLDDMLIPALQTLLHDVDPEVTSSALRAITHASRGNVREIPSRRQRTLSSNSVETTDSNTTTTTVTNNPVFIPVLSEEQVLRLLPTLRDLSQSRQWRVRQSAVEIVPALLGCTHLQSTKMEIANLCFSILKEDTVDAVRTTAAECLCSYPDDTWQKTVVLPQLRLLASSPLSKQRLLSIKMMQVLAPQHMSVILDILQSSLYSDPIVNVRLSVGRLLGYMITASSQNTQNNLEQIESICTSLLEYELQNDNGKQKPDRDVLYFAQQTLNTLKQFQSNV